MAKRPVSDFIRAMSAKYDVVISYDAFYRNVLSGLIPATRNDKETRWLIDDADEPVIVEALNIASMPSVASKRHPAAKPATKTASTRPSRPRTSCSASAA
jgi:hypothetical protein